MNTEDRVIKELTLARDHLEVSAALLQEAYPYGAAVVRSALQIVRTELKFFERRGGAPHESEADVAGQVRE